MIITVHPSSLAGSIKAPRSKSAMQRACAAALVSKGETILQDPGVSDDDQAALDIIQSLGATLRKKDDGSWQITSQGVFVNEAAAIQCGESGLSVRMFTPLAALAAVPIHMTGTGSLLNRPMDFFDTVLPQLQVQVKTTHGKLPLEICGPLQPANITVDGSMSSQFLTGLLMAYAAAGAHGVTITVDNLVSRPYIDLTLEIMRSFGMTVPRNEGYRLFHFEKSPASSIPATRNIHVEGDWSGTAFIGVAAALAGTVTVQGISTQSTQADLRILKAFEAAGIRFLTQKSGITVYQSTPGTIQAFEFDASDCPDLFPPLVALAATAKGTSRIRGISRLTHKESDRALTLQEEFSKLGLTLYSENDLLCIEGTTKLTGAPVSSRGDHRIAMALAVAALKASGSTTIDHAEAVHKSYPAFFEDLEVLGASLSLPGQ